MTTNSSTSPNSKALFSTVLFMPNSVTIFQPKLCLVALMIVFINFCLKDLLFCSSRTIISHINEVSKILFSAEMIYLFLFFNFDSNLNKNLLFKIFVILHFTYSISSNYIQWQFLSALNNYFWFRFIFLEYIIFSLLMSEIMFIN